MELFKTPLKPVARLVFGSLGWIEGQLLPDYKLRYSPTFIIGVPRTGTTLLCQIINHALSTCYFTNLALRMRVQGIRRPPAVFSAWLAKQLGLMDRRQEMFESDYGIAQGWGNPSDSVMMWQHWFSNRYMGAGELPSETQLIIYQVVAGTERVFGRPFVDKCTHNSIRIRALVEIFPTALFIQCVRSPLAVAQSLFYGSTRPGPAVGKWESARPKEYEDLKNKSLVEKVCGQVYFLEHGIAEDLAGIPPERVLAVDYRDVCLNPQRVVTGVEEFMNHNNAPTKQIRQVPSEFPFSNTRRINGEAYEALIDRLEHLYGGRVERLDEPS